MNFQPLIDNLPLELATLAFLFWAMARFTEAKAKADPKIDAWDTWAPRLTWVSKMYSQAIEWMCQSGAAKWSGAEKLAQLNSQVKGFEEQWDQGNYREALANLTGFYQAAKSKIEKVAAVTLPFQPPNSIVTNLKVSASSQEQAEIGPDNQAVEDTNGE